MWLARPRRSPHALLGVSPAATAAEVRAAYRRRAAELHPDRHPTRVAEATREFQELTQAYRDLTRADLTPGLRRGAGAAAAWPGERVDAFLTKVMVGHTSRFCTGFTDRVLGSARLAQPRAAF